MTNLVNELQRKIDCKTKPLGALGKLEKLALQIGKIQNTTTPKIVAPHILVFAGDHGIAREKVSAFPQEVTHQMVLNFLNGGAAINVFTRQHGIALSVVDAGVNHNFQESKGLLINKVAMGTRSFLNQKAMTRTELETGLKLGGEALDKLVNKECNLIGFGEMGIGNTASASALMSSFCNLPIEKCTGRGTGLDDQQLKAKTSTLKQALEFHGKLDGPYEILETFAGFEIVQICGAMLRAFARGMIILVDGFIATSALLAAHAIKPEILENCIFCHVSDEHAHPQMLSYLGAEPILSLNLRLGEGTGCALAYPVIQSSLLFLNEMASFESANVSEKESC